MKTLLQQADDLREQLQKDSLNDDEWESYFKTLKELNKLEKSKAYLIEVCKESARIEGQPYFLMKIEFINNGKDESYWTYSSYSELDKWYGSAWRCGAILSIKKYT